MQYNRPLSGGSTWAALSQQQSSSSQQPASTSSTSSSGSSFAMTGTAPATPLRSGPLAGGESNRNSTLAQSTASISSGGSSTGSLAASHAPNHSKHPHHSLGSHQHQQQHHQYHISAASSMSSSSASGGGGDSLTLQHQDPRAQAHIDEEQRQEENRKLRLQLYVFVLRCISYPFNAKQTNTGDLHPKQQQIKLRRQQLEQIVQLHTRFVKLATGSFNAALGGNTNSSGTTANLNSSSGGVTNANRAPHSHLKLSNSQMKQLDELYEQTHVRFNRKFLQNERMRMLVESECCSQQDLRDLFRLNAEQVLLQSGLFDPANQHPHHYQARYSRPETLQLTGGSGEGAEFGGRATGGGENVYVNLLASKDVILNSWLIKFESIIRDDPSGGLDASLGPAAGSVADSAAATPSSSILQPATGSAVGLSSAVSTAQMQQQQPQQLSKEQLYQMFQNILTIKKFEHQLLYNALQLDSSDEQAAAIRRELDGRIARIAELERNKKLLPKMVLKEMESLYLEEARMSVNKLMVNLDSLPVMKGSSNESRGVYGLQKFRRYNSSQLALSSKQKLTGRRPPAAGELDKRRYPVSSFLLSRAQQPLWSLTFSSLSSFGKIAAQASLNRDGLVESHPSEPTLTKLDVVLTFNVEVIVMEVRGLRHLAPTREIYCTMEIEGSERLQTEHVQAKKPLWDTQGDFTTNHPLPVLKIKLYAVNPSMLSLEDKELGKLVLHPTVLSPKTPEWVAMQPSASSAAASASSSANSGPGGSGGQQAADQELRIRVIVRMDRPQQLKHCGYLYGIGKSTWRKFKRRYHILIQVSQYTFVMCSYREKKAKPTEMLQLDGYTVDYIEPPTDLIMEHCSEMTSSEHHHASGASPTLGLAGRLANAILKQPGGSGGGTLGAGGIGSGGSGSNADGSGDGQMYDIDGQPSAIQTAAAMSDELHNKYYFNVVKEGDSVVFACDDEQECFGWVMALYRATGQAHKPTPLSSGNQYSSTAQGSASYIDAAFNYQTSATQPGSVGKLAGHSALSGGSSVCSAGSSSLSISSMLNGGKGTKSSVDVADQRARKHGMDEFISADPCKFQHNQLFRYLQNETLRYRLEEPYCSLGWFSSGQILVLDEYCARYGVRTCFRHLAYLDSLLDFNQRCSYFIDHTLLNYGYDFCASHVSGNSTQAHPIGSVNFDLRPDGIGTVTVEERDLFHSVKGKLLKMIERQIANFSYCFPFGKPYGALKATLSLLERVLMKEQQTNSMIQNEEVRNLIRKCLEQAALNNYTKLSGQANLLGPLPPGRTTPPPAPSPVIGPNAMTSQSPQPHDIDAQQQQSSEQQTGNAAALPLAAIGARLRTASNLSSSSLASGASSAGSTMSGSISSANSEPMRRQQRMQDQHQQQSQQPQQCLTMAMIINNEHVKPGDKLRHLIRLAELCCEQVEDNNEFFSDDFAWHSDLMMEHFELFWSLFSVDMDKILSEAIGTNGASAGVAGQAGVSGGNGPGGQSSSSMNSYARSSISGQSGGDILGISNREAFSLFQVLNNHMCKSSNLECRKFKTHLCDTFKPKLLRYIDIMESTLTRMLFKASEKDGQVNCLLIEQMFVKLDDLQRFILVNLRWPDEQLAEQLNQRLKLMSYEVCDACVQRTQSAFLALEKKSNKWTATTTSYSSPVDMIQMINLVLDTRSRSLKLCTFNGFDQMSYHSKIDKLVESAMGEMQPGLMAKMLNALDSTLTKLARYDEGNLLAPILSLTTKQGMSSSGRDIGKQYVSFVSNCCDLLRHKINDELWIVNLLEDWYAAQMNVICNWLAERIDRSLHEVQFLALANMMPKIYADMSLQGVSEDKLNLKSYQTIMSRLTMEEASAQAGGNLFEQASGTSIFNTSSILSSLTSSSSSNPDKSVAPSHRSGVSSQPTVSGLATPLRQPYQGTSGAAVGGLGSRSDSPSSLQTRRVQAFGSSATFSSEQMGGPVGNSQAEPQEGDNMADRAFQSATRIFKGFWAN